MNAIYFVTAAVLIAGLSSAFSAILTGPIINPANGHTYYLLEADTWANSEARAVELGGHLATINDAQENQWILSTFSSFGDTARHLWIGLNDMASEGIFVWTSGEQPAFSNWNTGEPNNNGNEDGVHLYPSNSPAPGRWNDLNPDLTTFGGSSVHGVVEVSGVVVSIKVHSVQLEWNSESGRIYQVQYLASLGNSEWQNLGDPIVAAGLTSTKIDVVVDQAARYYRIIPLP